jgi:hypothetical protein
VTTRSGRPTAAPGRHRSLPGALLLAGVLLVGCAPPDLTPAPGDEVAGDRDAAGPGTREEGPAPGIEPPGGTAPAPPAAPPALEDCAQGDLEAMDEVIAAQLAAFAADDWEGALEHASSDFREGLDADAFAHLIEEGFPEVADAVDHRADACVTRGTGAAEVRVQVTAADGARADLLYLLVDEEGWRIAGAVPLETDDGTLTT